MTKKAAKVAIEVFDKNKNRRATLRAKSLDGAHELGAAECEKQDTDRPAMAPHRYQIAGE